MSDWSNLESCLLELVLQKLEYRDVIRSKAVCRPWHKTVDAYVPSRRSAMAGLIIPAYELDEEEHGRSFQFYDLKHEIHIKLKDVPEEIYNGACIGSSHGWLVFIDSDLNLCLFDPFTKARKQISRPESFPGVHPPNYDVPGHGYPVEQMGDHGVVEPFLENRARRFRMYRMNKAALSSNPSLHMHKHNKRRHGLLVIHSIGCYEYCTSRLAFYSFEDEKWTELPLPSNGDGTEFGRLCINDAIWYNGQLYVLVRDDSIEVWDFEGSSPRLTKQIRVGMWGKVYQAVISMDCESRSYMVESLGDLLIVTRFVQRGRPSLFHVHKLDYEKETVEQVDSLHGRALFLGGNHSQSFTIQDLPSCEENSIYFTDECWNGRWCYPTRKHDVGIFNLKEGTVKYWPQLESKFFKEPALWFFSI